MNSSLDFDNNKSEDKAHRNFWSFPRRFVVSKWYILAVLDQLFWISFFITTEVQSL